MGNDYDSRRQNKRLNKKAGREAAEKGDAKDKRKRTKVRAKVGRGCLSLGVPRASCGQYADLQVSIAWQGQDHDKLQRRRHVMANVPIISLCAFLQTRRLCRGPCFGEPSITEADAEWRESDDEAAEAWTQPDSQQMRADPLGPSTDGKHHAIAAHAGF